MSRSVASRAMICGALGLAFVASCGADEDASSGGHGDAGATDAASLGMTDADDAGGLSKQQTPTPTDSGNQLPRLDAGTTTDGAPSLLSIERACSMAAQAICTRGFTCAPQAFGVRFGDRVRCQARLESACADHARAPGTGLTVTNLALCAREVETVACDGLVGNYEPRSCFPSGARAVGASCGADSQCGSGYCSRGDGCGSCAARMADGQLCSGPAACAPGRTCSSNGVCVVPGQLGATCEASSAPCLPSLSCVGRRCVTPLAAGATCEQTAQCDALAGATCQPLSGRDAKVCMPGRVAAAGSTCGALPLGGPATCFGGDLLCRGEGANARCVAPAADGAPCGTRADGAPCVWPAACVSGTCVVTSARACL